MVRRQEEIGFKLVSLQATTFDGTNFTQVCFDDQSPNDGPYSQIVPAGDGANSAFIQNVKTNVNIA
jgi:hypothetical protein